MKTLLMFTVIAATAVAQGTSTTAISINGSMSVSYADGSTANMGVAISGNETVTTNAAGQVISGSFSGTVTVGGVEFKVKGLASSVRADGSRYYRFKFKKGGTSIEVSISLGHPQIPTLGGVRLSENHPTRGHGHGTTPSGLVGNP